MVIFDKICNTLHGLKPAISMVLVQISLAGVIIFYKIANSDGMNVSVLIAYRYVFAALFIVPIAFFVERNKRPKLTKVLFFQTFLCGLLGGASQTMYVMSLTLTSATFATAMMNLTTAVTFIVAVLFRMEKLSLRTPEGKAKVIGTFIGIGGAMLLTFYKGPELDIWRTHFNVLHNSQKQHAGQNPILGAVLTLVTCICVSLWLILQAKIAENYPCPYSNTAMMNIWAGIQCGILALILEHKDLSVWKLGWNIRLAAVLYCGVVASGLAFTLMAWCVAMKGPLFASVFTPLILVVVAIVGSLILNEQLHLGSVLGSILVVIGLYVVLWAKGKEVKRLSGMMQESLSREESKRFEFAITSTTPMEMGPSSLPRSSSVALSRNASVKIAIIESERSREGPKFETLNASI